MKVTNLFLIVFVLLFSSCSKEKYSVIAIYQDLYINEDTGNTVVHDIKIDGSFDTYITTSKNIKIKAEELIKIKAERIKVDVCGKEIIDIEEVK